MVVMGRVEGQGRLRACYKTSLEPSRSRQTRTTCWNMKWRGNFPATMYTTEKHAGINIRYNSMIVATYLSVRRQRMLSIFSFNQGKLEVFLLFLIGS